MQTRRTPDENRIPGRPRPRATAVPGRLRALPDPPKVASPRLADERRMRNAGGPVDNATYTCSCGLIFEAAVSTGVQCPSCGTGQAW